jgi:hypothetical protein
MPDPMPGQIPEEEIEKTNISGQEQVLSPEEQGSLEVAKRKLARLLDPEFKDFAVRFMTSQEYMEMVENRKITKGEAFVFTKSDQDDGISFKDYLDKANGDWLRTIERQTEWSHSSFNIEMASNFVSMLNRSRQQVKETQGGVPDNYREEVIKDFRKSLIHLLRIGLEGNDPLNSLSRDVMASLPNDEAEQASRSAFDSRMTPEQRQERDEYWKRLRQNIDEGSRERYGEQNWEIFKNFYQDENWLKTKGNLRLLYNALCRVNNPKIDDYFRLATGGYQNKQYHVAAVFDLSAIGFKGSWSHEKWGLLQASQEDDQSAAQLQGAISVMPIKEMWEEMVEVSSHAEAMAHPIFDSYGLVRYPKSK